MMTSMGMPGSEMTGIGLWLIIFVAGLITFATRLSFIVLLERIKVPAWFQRALRFVPVAVLSAIILSESVNRNGVADLSLRNPQMIAAALAVLVAWRTRNVILTIIAGMLSLLAAQALLGNL
jgi:branched-subunit amino acid transport protein